MSDSMPENYGQGESGPEITAPVGNENGFESTTDQTVDESKGHNPSWDEALNLLPDDYLRGKVKPVFEKWDSNNNERFTKLQEQYKPYEELIQHDVKFDRIKEAFEFQNRVANHPQDVFKALAAHLGYDVESLLNPGSGANGESLVDEDAEDPRLTEMRRIQDGMLNVFAQQEIEKEQAAQKQQEQTWFDETVTSLNSLEEKYGKFDRNRVVREALYLHETTGKPIDFEAGVRSLAELTKTAFANSASSKAPGVFSGNGSLQSGRVDTKNMSDKEQEEYVARRMAELNGGR